jgi:hypothetical protein
MRNILFTICFFCYSVVALAQLKSPADYFPNYGKQVTYYHQVEEYFNYLVQNSKNIQYRKYGITTQERNLNAYYISSESNLNQLEKIRLQHLSNIGMHSGKTEAIQDKVIVWLSFNVHGNEIGAIESALKVAFQLLSPENKEAQQWLKETIVILDPCLNPDGFSRYANWLRDISGSKTHPKLSDREHMEPWPGGRQNHYVYDLNRDWAWQTQIESQQRMDFYHEWMPNIHVDVHEMGYNEPYFFPPAAEPFHDQITNYQKEFHQKVGAFTAKKFDKQGWMYYSGERFDLFYPSYGDTYPSFNGAIGMTYEQGGIGAGRAIQKQNGEILTLQDRIDHHTTAVLAAVELASKQKENLIKEFNHYFKENRKNPKSKYKTYVVKNSPKNTELLKLLKRNRIESAFAAAILKTKGLHYQSNIEKSFIIEPDDIIIKTDQPKSVLTQVLFDLNPRLTDSLTYDITAWALPFAYGVETYALKSDITIKTQTHLESKAKIQPSEMPVAYYIGWNDRNSTSTLSKLLQQNFRVRYAKKNSNFGTTKIKAGGLIVAKGDNIMIPDFETSLIKILEENSEYIGLESGFGSSGADLGGEYYPLIQTPKVMLFAGNKVSNIDFGQVWFYMDKVIDYPVSIVDTQNFFRINWSEYNTLVMPEGNYNFSEAEMKVLDDFVNRGGKIIAIGNALSTFEDREGYKLTAFATNEEKELVKKEQEELLLKNRFSNYDANERRFINTNFTGAIIENKVDTTHPLSFGLGDPYFSIKTSDKSYKLLKGVQNVIYVPKDYKSFGFIGSSVKKSLQEIVTYSVEYKGNGTVIYMVDNPLFRGFWENGNLLFSNALFFVK